MSLADKTHNAEAMQRGNAARLVRDAEMTGERLAAIVSELSGSNALEIMAAAARRMAKPGAASRAADILEEAAGG